MARAAYLYSDAAVAGAVAVTGGDATVGHRRNVDDRRRGQGRRQAHIYHHLIAASDR